MITITSSGDDVTEFANLAIQFATLVIAVFGLGLAAVTLLGIREVRLTRKQRLRLEEQLLTTSKANEAFNKRLETLEEELDSMISVSHYYSEGEAAYLRADYDPAIENFQLALSLQPDNSRVAVRLARTLVNIGQTDRAERSLRRLIDQGKGVDASVWLAIATCHRYRDYDAAIKAVDEALKINPYNVAALNYLGLLHRDLCEFDEAIGAHEEALGYDSTDPTTWFFVSLLYFAKGKPERGSEAIRQAKSLKDAREITGKMKKLWSRTIEWVYLRETGDGDAEQKALGLVHDIVANDLMERDRTAVLQHWEFYIIAIGGDPAGEESLNLLRNLGMVKGGA